MRRRLRVLVSVSGLFGLVLPIALVLAPTVAAGDPCYHGYVIPATTTAATSTVNLEPCAFVPTLARIPVGGTVTFTNVSQERHLVTGANAAWGDRDKEIPARASLEVRFDHAGVYAYSCALHRGMSGAVIVGDQDSDAAATAATTGGSDGPAGPMTIVALSGLATLAAVGWAVAWQQRRRAGASAPVEA